jgi:hypothetical protein
MRNLITRTILFIIALAMALDLCACLDEKEEKESLVIANARASMLAGERQTLSVYSTETETIYEAPLTYKSSDPSVATVNDFGVVTAVSPGEAVIRVQSAVDTELKTELALSVTYKTVSESVYAVTERSGTVDASAYSFWSANGYTARGSNWDVLDIAKILITKGTDEYVFTEVYSSKKVERDTVLVLSDWGNDDVLLNVNSINSDVFAEMLEKLHLDPDVSIGTVTRVNEAFARGMDERINTYKGIINLSDMPTDKEYRVSIVMDYSVLKVKNYYSRGALDGIWQLGSDLIKGNIDSLMDSYTYVKYEHEIVDCVNVDVLIEER